MTLLQSSMMALLVTKILSVVSYVLWILNWWQFSSNVQLRQLSTNTVDLLNAQLIVQFLSSFKNKIYVFCCNSMVVFSQSTIL